MLKYTSLYELKYKTEKGWVEKCQLDKLLSCMYELPLSGIHGESLCIFFTQDIQDGVNTIQNQCKSISDIPYVNKEILLLNSVESATIEGAQTTVQEIKKVLKSNKSENKSHIMVSNILKGINYAFHSTEVFSKDGMLTLWNIVTTECCENLSVQGNIYRKGKVYIGNESKTVHVPESPSKIPAKMNQLYDFISSTHNINAILKSIIIHFYYVYIHTMCDGNGRTARILMQAYLQHNHFADINRTPVISEIRKNVSGYYKSLEQSMRAAIIDGDKVMDITPFIAFMLDVLESSILNFSLLNEKLSEKEKYLLSRMSFAGKGSEITSKKCSKMLHTSIPASRSILNSLSEKGILEKRKDGSTNIYRLSSW